MMRFVGAYRFLDHPQTNKLASLDINYYRHIISIEYTSIAGIYRIYYPRVVTAINSEGFNHYKRPIMAKIYR